MKRSLIRRIIGITAFVLAVGYVVLKFSFGESIRIIGQLDNWGLLIVSILGIAYTIIINIEIVEERKSGRRDISHPLSQEKQPEIKRVVEDIIIATYKIGMVVYVLVGLAIGFGAVKRFDYKVWENENYAVYSDYGRFFGRGPYYLFEKNGFYYKRLYPMMGDMYYYKMGDNDWDRIKSANYAIYEPLDLIKEEADICDSVGDSTLHIITFYRLSTGCQYDRCKNNSLFKKIGDN